MKKQRQKKKRLSRQEIKKKYYESAGNIKRLAAYAQIGILQVYQ